MKKTNEELKNAIEVLQKHLSEDKSEGSYYHSWQANIAVAFQDEWNRSKFGQWMEFNRPQWIKDLTPEGSSFIHTISNQAAKNFLDLLIKSQ